MGLFRPAWLACQLSWRELARVNPNGVNLIVYTLDSITSAAPSQCVNLTINRLGDGLGCSLGPTERPLSNVIRLRTKPAVERLPRPSTRGYHYRQLTP
jgi:hypothetical protein